MALRGLTVANGRLLLDGVRFRNIGLNYPGAIVRVYSQPSPTACEYTPSAEQDQVLAYCAAMRVKVLRIKATPFWPAQWRYGVNAGVAGVASTPAEREAYYQRIDAFIAKCRAAGIGVILSLFFRLASACDLAGETVRTGWMGASSTRTYVTAVTQELVTRYLTEEAVYGWELSNEVNHYNDATDATKGNYPAVNTLYGTPASYPAATNIFNGSDWASVCSWWYGIVTAIDNQRIVLTGNGACSYWRPGGAQGVPSPLLPFFTEQVRDNPMNCGEIHFYGDFGYGSPNFRGLNALLTGTLHWQNTSGRGFFLGEFGNQPWQVTSIVGNGTIVTINTSISCPLEAGDPFKLAGVSPFNGDYVCLSINTDRSQITAQSSVVGSWSGSVIGLQTMTADRLQRMLTDINYSECDVACFWSIDLDPLSPIWNSLTYSGNEALMYEIGIGNAVLGW